MTASSQLSPDLPRIAGFSLRWQGTVLIVRPDCWRNLLDPMDAYEANQQIVPALRALAPQFLIFNLAGIETFWAAMHGTLLCMIRDIGGLKRRELCVAVGVTSNARAHWLLSRFDKLFEIMPTEADALRHFAAVIAEERVNRSDGNVKPGTSNQDFGRWNESP